MYRKFLAVIGLMSSMACASQSPSSSPIFTNPRIFSSHNHVLDVLLIARPETIQLNEFHPTAWIYEVCETSVAIADQCPADSRVIAPGGVIFAVKQGDHLRMRLVNHLPPAPADAENAHGDDPMMNAMLAANPTNIHTHGLIVEPRKADDADPTYGDYVYVLGYPAGRLPPMVDPDMVATDKPIQYDIYIPPNHPSGMYYFHPHVHGLGVNQISEGLEGILTVGSITDYASNSGSFGAAQNYAVRYIDVRDMQVLPNGDVQDQEEPDFCTPTPTRGDARLGSCAGQDHSMDSPDPGPNYKGGKWFFSLNGQVYPTINLDRKNGEVWRLLNGAASRSYDLTIQNDRDRAPVVFQVLSLDGVALAPTKNTGVTEETVGGRFHPVPCPGSRWHDRSSEPVCATHMVMFPSSRAEIWLSPSQVGRLKSARLVTTDYNTGPAGDDWPSANLARLTYQGPASASDQTLNVREDARAALSATGALGGPVKAMYPGMSRSIPVADAQQIAAGSGAMPFALDTASAQQVHSLRAEQVKKFESRLAAQAKPVASIASASCAALPAGHRRRVYFGVPASNPDAFGFGYEEIDSKGRGVPGTFQDIAQFDAARINVCLPLAPGNQTTTEVWELVNVAGEAHNFHMHQTKFLVLPKGAPAGDGGALMDNVPLPSGGALCDGSVATWRSGDCKVTPVYVSIPFSEVGDYVYHCHIGEHQDGGMMAHIRVVTNP